MVDIPLDIGQERSAGASTGIDAAFFPQRPIACAVSPKLRAKHPFRGAR